MKIQFESNEILDGNDLREIATDIIKKEMEKKFSLDNLAHYLKESFVKDFLTEKKDELMAKISDNFDKFKIDSYTISQNSITKEILNSALEAQRESKQKQFEEYISSKGNDDFEYYMVNKISEWFADYIHTSLYNSKEKK